MTQFILTCKQKPELRLILPCRNLSGPLSVSNIDAVLSRGEKRAGVFMSSEWTDKRPMSPHLQVWRWHGAMMSSILHRASAIICYVALIIVSLGLLAVGLTGELPLAGLVFSPLGAVGLFVFLFAFIFMALAQLRHAIWNRGELFDPQMNNRLSYAMIVLALILAVVLTVVGVSS